MTQERVYATALLLLATLAVVARGFHPSHHVGHQHGSTRRRFAFQPSPLASSKDVTEVCDVLVLGSGPAARCIASLLSANSESGSPLQVILSDQKASRPFVPNFGVWQDEWQAVVDRYATAGVTLQGGKVGMAIDYEWDVTDCYFGGSFEKPMDERLRLDRPYYRVDKNALRESLTPSGSYKTIEANHFSKAISPNVYTPANSLVHDESGTTMQLKTADGEIVTVRSKLVVDCTGHETRLVLRDTREPYRPPGFQIAYGCLVKVKDAMTGPYQQEAMTLFDYRTDHYESEEESTQNRVANGPTFMYAMPLGGNRIFFEETSLVARPAISFQECKDRCFQRLEYHGIEVTELEEEEFCYIPMGGALPAKDQRVLGLGGAAAMVHPSTGYHLCRCLMGAADVAEALKQELSTTNPNLDQAAAAAYDALWSPSNIRQRNFAVFGGEFLMKQNVVGLRGFFDGFFRLPLPLWAGFLAGWPGLPNNDQHETWAGRLWYGLSFVVRLPPAIAADMLASILTYSVKEGTPLLQSVTPFFGEPPSFAYKVNTDGVGDVAAKIEARRMIEESSVEETLPVAFEDGPTAASSETTKSTPSPTIPEPPIVLQEIEKEPAVVKLDVEGEEISSFQ